jgi:hypothetical protein
MPIRRNRRTRLKPSMAAVDPLEAAISGGNPFEELVNELIEKNIQDVEAIRSIERRAMFDPKQSVNFCSAYDPDRSRDVIRGLCSPQLAREYELVSRWFSWRGNGELATRYTARALVVHEILSAEEEKESSR